MTILSDGMRFSLLPRFRTTTSTSTWRSLKEYVGLLKENQTSIYYHTGDDITRLEASPHLEGFRARGVEVLLLSDPVDSFWAGTGVSFDGKPFKSVTQGTADLELIPNVNAKHEFDLRRRQGESRDLSLS